MSAAPIEVAVERLPHAAGLDLPSYATAGSAGLDLRAAVEEILWLASGARAVIPTGLKLAIPEGWEGQVRARSGLALKQGLALVNAPGTIDSDYRGEVGVLAINLSDRPIAIRRGDRIAQLVLSPTAHATLTETPSLESTTRGPGGFGSTGRG